MPDPARADRLQPSLLDRLTDHAPDKVRETPDQQSLTMAQLREAVLRDLAWLLNTTRTDGDEMFADHPRAAQSTINYGIPPLAGLATESDPRLCETWLAAAIQTFEPRIFRASLEVQLRPAEDDNPLPALKFDIAGELWAEPVPQALFLETSIEVETQTVSISESKQPLR